MRVAASNGRTFHLTYCTNVHPGTSIDEVCRVLDGPVKEVRDSLGRRAAEGFGVGLRLAGPAASSLAADAGARKMLTNRLDALDAYAMTVNAFPMGEFHREGVKSDVYRPDWHEESRVQYTLDVAQVMAELPSRTRWQSISTVPGSFKAFSDVDQKTMARNFGRVAVELARIEEQTSRWLRLAVEPEPGCTFETTDEWVTFYRDHLLGADGGAPEDVVTRHIGTCLDACHQAVEFEKPREVVQKLSDAGVPLAKVQLSCAIALSSPSTNIEGLQQLARFDEPVYLHQVMARRAGGDLEFFEDLPAFLAAAEKGDFVEARSHFHVPIFTESLGAIATTRCDLEELLDAVVTEDLTDHLEIETYSWNVMPGREVGENNALTRDIVREYEWVLGQLDKEHA